MFFFFNNCIVPLASFPWKIRVAFPGESQLRQSRAIQPTAHAGCFSVSLIHRILTRTTGTLTCAHNYVNARDCTRGVYGHRKRVCTESWPWGKKIPCRTEESNLRQLRAGPTTFQLSYIPVNTQSAAKITSGQNKLHHFTSVRLIHG